MTSYMYNPSKKVTELLSEYLEFDPEELRVGIWSGDLSIRNVHLREEAIYPLLNQHMHNTSGFDKEYQKPPLRFKLVSGTIGNFDMKIPWKRLVWGNGDVRVDLRNVVLVLALETRDETRERYRSRKSSRASAVNDEKREQETENDTQQQQENDEMCVVDLMDDILFESLDGEDDYRSRQPEEDPVYLRSIRKRKQKRLREAESRAFQGRELGPWLARRKKEDDEERAKLLEKAATQRLEKESSRWEKWLRGTVNDFFWRFLSGLRMNIENLKIILVQDGVEIGLNIPSVTVAAGQQSMQNGDAPRSTQDDTSTSQPSLGGSAPPTDVKYEGADDDGEHVDKRAQITQVGIYVRNQVASFRSSPSLHAAVDISTKEYILRPVDMDFSFSLFFPYPPEKRKKKKAIRKRDTPAQDTGVRKVAGAVPCDSSTVSSKRRRGKREKTNLETILGEKEEPDNFSIQLTEPPSEPTTQMTEQFTTEPMVLPKATHVRRLTDTGARAHTKLNLPSATPEKGHRVRRSSLYGPMSAISVAKPSRGIPHSSTITLPLARPQNMAVATAAVKTTARSGDLSPRMEGKMNVGAVQLMCSTHHYELLCIFVTGGARLRNGRPSKTIRSVLDQGQALRKSLTVTALAKTIDLARRGSLKTMSSDLDGRETRQVRLELRSARTERSEVIESWWRYAVGAIIWELRHRRRIRKAFQERFLSFSWERLRYKREEYVRLFIQNRLVKQATSPTEALLKIEDELSIEQILLYRSLARKVHVRGESKFPKSVLDLQTNQDVQRTTPDDEEDSPFQRLKSPITPGKEEDGLRKHDDSRPSTLGLLEAQGELCRRRKETADGQALPPNKPFLPLSKFDGGPATEYDDMTYATTKTAETMTTSLLNPSVLEDRSAMLFSFAVMVEEIELLVVEEQVLAGGYMPPRTYHSDERSSDSPMSDVSVLTDDFRYDKNDVGGKTDSEIIDDPIVSSTDYLLFSAPEMILLRVVLSPLNLSLLGTIGHFANLNFTINQIEVSGEDGSLLSMGTVESKKDEVDLSMNMVPPCAQSQRGIQRNAVSLSLVRRKGGEGTSMQCDAATINVTPDFKTRDKVLAFASQSSLYLPSTVLQRSPKEEVRLYVLRQSSQSVFTRINASVRIHGLELMLKSKAPGQNTVSDSTHFGGSILRFGMIEMYSGSTVDLLDFDTTGLSMDQPNAETRKLRMIGGTDLHASAAPLAHRWVVATSGIDLAVAPSSDEGRLSFMQSPVDFEILVTLNTNSVMDFTRANVEALVKVSPVQLILSESRLQQLSATIPDVARLLSQNTSTREDTSLPPRLEVLSRFIIMSVEVQVSRFRVCLMSYDTNFQPPSKYAKEIEMGESITDFLSVVSCFDLGFPHEEALSSAMQVCIDRLAGLGLPLEEAWQLSNTALLNFLEDMTDARQADVEASTLPMHTNDGLDIVGSDAKDMGNTMQKSASRTVAAYVDELHADDSELQMLSHDVVVDLSEGASFSTIQLFYDSHTYVSVPSFFVANGDGIHLLRLTPAVDSFAEPHDQSKHSGDMDSEESSEGSGQPEPCGIQLHSFGLDKNSPFGRGGDPLAVLGSDSTSGEDCETRVREQLVDLELGDVELFLTRELANDLTAIVLRVFSPILDHASSSRAETRIDFAAEKHILAVCKSASMLLASESLVPFSRCGLGNIVAKQGTAQGRLLPGPAFVNAESLEVFNLSPESEMYPEIVSLLHSGSSGETIDSKILSTPIWARYDFDDAGGELELILHSIRIVYLHQFLSEILQYFFSEKYGIMGALKEVGSASSGESKSAGLRYKVSFLETSILIPKSSWSSDILAVEARSITFESSRPRTTFSLPTRESGLCSGAQASHNNITSEDGADFVDCQSVAPGSIGETEDSKNSTDLSRLLVGLCGIRLFTSLSETRENDSTVEYPSFNFFFGIDGRAGSNKPVYTPRNVIDSEVVSEAVVAANAAKALRCWREISKEEFSIDVIIDHAPHKRILLTGPRDGSSGNLSLDVMLSQFCLLQSLWHCNLQELPRMFPFTTAELKEVAEDPSTNVAFPDLGSEEMKELLMNPLAFTSEFCIVLDKISLRCTFDCFDEKGRLLGETPGIALSFGNVVFHQSYDALGVGRAGLGCSEATLKDESRVFDTVVSLGSPTKTSKSWADMTFGLREDFNTLGKVLPQQFQLSVFMLSSWKMFNLGMDGAEMILSDLDTVWRFLEFVTSYYSDAKHGHPAFAAMEASGRLKATLKEQLSLDGDEEFEFSDEAGKTDFRLWLTSPTLVVPCQPLDSASTSLRFFGKGGLWYRYTSIDAIAIQECATGCLSLGYWDCVSSGGHDQTTSLIENLSFGFRMDFNSLSNHTDYSLRIPFNDSGSCSLTSGRISVAPAVVETPTICTPYCQPHRFLGPQVCELTFLIELLPVASSTLLGLFAGGSDDELKDTPTRRSESTSSSNSGKLLEIDEYSEASPGSPSIDQDMSSGTFSAVASVGDVRCFALDPVLGPHLPVAVLSIAGLKITASQFDTHSEKAAAARFRSSYEDIHVVADGHFWVDYFKLGVTRSWEPLMEAYSFSILWVKSRLRGSGTCLSSDSPLQLNVSSAFLMIVNQVFETYARLLRETFDSDQLPASPPATLKRSRADTGHSVRDLVEGVPIVHRLPENIDLVDRVAFSMKNLTGQKIRIFHTESQADSPAGHSDAVTYLNHHQIAQLSFQPSVSMIENLAVKEVTYPGLNQENAEVESHVVDVQVPGCRWLRGLKVDTFGRSFASIVPRSAVLRQRTEQDWRLSNLMKVLIEVGLENGGRQVTVRSLFSVVNKTCHSIRVLCHPDASYNSVEPDLARLEQQLDSENSSHSSEDLGDECLEPGGSYHVPTLLLVESLRRDLNHMGSIWVKPGSFAETSDVMQSFMNNSSGSLRDDVKIYFSSKPVQLSRIVNESASIFDGARGQDVSPDSAKSGVQVSCPVIQETGDRLAPFCYAVEVGRSPLVKGTVEQHPAVESKSKFAHGPVSYTISIFPPFVVANLLPKRGRFELMHAVRRTVLWFADLEAGEEVAIHSVGLDAPLLLLINLGFCRTPVGEGALVHHGTDPHPGARDNLSGLKSIGKAGKAVTRQLGKTLTAIGESPDKRGQDRLNLARNPQLLLTRSEKHGKKHKRHRDLNELSIDLDLDTPALVDGKTYKIDSSVFFPHDVSDETTLVDGVGQKITLSLENIRGGGGQRRISIFCPFWIVNTTEHALRFKQENSKTFVSGTVVSPDKNGSTVLSTHPEATNVQVHREGRTPSPLLPNADRPKREVFSGTPGALALKPGRCSLEAEEVAELVDGSLSLEKLAESAFMFNFHDEISLGIGNQRLCIQLGDGTGVSQYQSDWSRGLSLDSVGISQVISMHCKDGRFLELTVLVYVAPGELSSYTKIVRLLPRYVVVNALPYPVRLWQDSSVFRPATAEQVHATRGDNKWRYRKPAGRRTKVNQYDALWGREATLDAGFGGKICSTTTANKAALYISTVGSSQMIPFTLPDSRGQRQLRIGLGAPFNLTASFSADVAGDHVLALTRAVDLKLLPHVSTRASPEYVVTLFPGIPGFSGELGVWYETEWGSSRRIIVKAVKKTSYAFNQTDIHVGDELTHIDGVSVAKNTFAEVMSRLRERLNEISTTHQDTQRNLRRATMRLVGRPQSSASGKDGRANTRPLMLRLRTVEERLRRVRLKAAKENAIPHIHRSSPSTPGDVNHDDSERSTHPSDDVLGKYIRAELKTLHHMMFLVLREDSSPPFQIQNQTFSSTIYYRQKGCNGHSWHSLNPGKTSSYAWQEPLKLKRLSVRVASETTFLFSEESDHEDSDKSEESGSRDRLQRKNRRDSPVGGAAKHRKVTDEEDAVFSTAVNVRLEEIGFRDFLPWQHVGKEGPSSYQWLELEVDVVGATRVLVIRDVSKEGQHQVQWDRHLDSLRQGIEDERVRLRALDSLNDTIVAHAQEEYEPVDPIGESTHNTAEEAKNLMSDFSGGPFICACHQLIVEVIEAIGLSTDAFVGDCNPYAEVRLKSGEARQSFFRKNDVRRTYFVRKSLKPTWEMQSFVFDVPPDAVDVPRGHAVSIRLLNHRSLGYDNLLGKAQVDLHTLRNQEPLVGWFPLAGRTGRRELENQLSHWGRGSVRLRLQWIYSIPALMQYFILLSEARVVELQTRLEGLVEQMQQRQAADAKKMKESDGFKPVRIQDFLSISKKKRRLGKLSKEAKPIRNSDIITSMKKPLRASSGAKMAQPPSKKRTRSRVERFPRLTPDSGKRHSGKLGFRDNEKITHVAFQDLEDRISQQRQHFHKLLSRSRDGRKDLASNVGDLAAQFGGTSLKSWTIAQVLFNDPELETEVEYDVVHARLKVPIPARERKKRPESEMALSEKLQLPLHVPSPLNDFSQEQISSFLSSRESFERAARRSLSAVLHHGGWLTIRPIRALNLPDSYNGMSVKLRYGSQVLATGTVDAKVSPTWSVSTSVDDLNGSKTMSQGSLHENFYDQPNDLHIHVTPQKTSGLIRLSVYGEKSQQKLQSKTELGILHLPLGNAIAACVDADTSESGIAMYERWFPLITPRDAVPVEGDGGLSLRPPESEKQDERGFKDYYKPCMQIALIWHPDKEFAYEKEDEEEEFADTSDHPPAQSGVVKSYFNADIARISVALIDSERALELLSFNVLDLDVRYWTTNAKTRYGVSLYWLQLDHQDEHSREPIVLAPTPNDFLFPVVQVFAVKDNVRSADVISFDFIDVSVAEFDLTIEESLFYDLYAFFTSVSFQKGIDRISPSVEEAGNHRDEPSLSSLLAVGFNDESKKAEKVYIEQLFLGIIRVNLSYVKGKRAAWDLTNKSVRWVDKRIEDIVKPFSSYHKQSDVFAAWSRQTSDDDRLAEEQSLQTLPKLFTALFPNLSDAPVRLQGKALNHVFESPTEIFHSIRKFYVNETLKQIYKIIGSLDFVGNPTMLVSSLFSGVRDLVVAPSTAFMNSPTDPSRVGMGVAKGTLSLLSHSTSGFFSFCAKVSATAGQAVATLSLDPDFSQWHRERVLVEATNLNRHWKKRGVQSIGAMLMKPVSDVVIGVVGGVFGILISPIRGYRRNGTAGLARGIAVGGIGVVTRPVVGVLDAFAHFTGSIHDIAKSVNILERRLQPALKIRLSYTFGIMGILTPFELTMARADYLLKLFPLKKSRKAALLIPETMIHVEVLPNNGTDTYAIATTARVALVRVKKEASGELSPSLCWELYFATDTSLSSRVVDHGHSGVALTITLTRSASSGKERREKNASRVSSLNDSILSPGLLSNLDASEHEHSVEMGDGLSILDPGKDFEHHTGRGSKGERLEWFTILAEYQYRRQLGRLHNAISCIVGDFESVIRDPSLGHQGGQRGEGYTTFGIYHFAEKDSVRLMENRPDLGIAQKLDSLPWISESTFQDVANQPPSEQERALALSRQDWDFPKQLEVSRDEGGPEWLITGRAWAQFLPNEGDETSIDSFGRNPLSLTEVSSRKHGGSATVSTEQRKAFVDWDDNSVSYTGAFGMQEVSDNSELTTTARIEDSKLLRPRAPHDESSDDTGSSKSPMDKLGQLKTFPTPRTDEGSMKESPFVSPRLPRNRKEDWMQSFVTASGASPGNFTTPLANMSDSMSYSVGTKTDKGSADGTESGRLNLPRQRGRSEDDVFASARQKSATSSGYVSASSTGMQRVESNSKLQRGESVDETSAPPVATPQVAPAPQTQQTAPGDRLSRMEALMEQLLIFSSEQAIVRDQQAATAPPPAPANEEISMLRQEISHLRSDLQQRKAGENSSAEIAALREEIAWMKGQLQLTAWQPTQSQRHAFPGPVPAPTQQPQRQAQSQPDGSPPSFSSPAAAPQVPLSPRSSQAAPVPAAQPARPPRPPPAHESSSSSVPPPVVESSPETPQSENSSRENATGSPVVLTWLTRSENSPLVPPQDLDSIQEVD